MRKIVKILLATTAALFLLLNLSFNVNGNRIEDLRLSTRVNSAQADAFCFWNNYWGQCYCNIADYNCPGPCPGSYSGFVCEPGW